MVKLWLMVTVVNEVVPAFPLVTALDAAGCLFYKPNQRKLTCSAAPKPISRIVELGLKAMGK